MVILPDPLSFDWDEGNKDKNFLKHKVSTQETEEVFSNEPLIIFSDEKHSDNEERFLIWGKSNNNRKLAIIFIVRQNKIRIISARDMNKKEKEKYEKKP